MRFAVYEPTPVEVADHIDDLIKDKRVVDLGGGDGSFCNAMAQYASSVTNIEIDERLAEQSEQRGIHTIRGSFMEQDLSTYDVIYAFLSLIGAYNLTQKLNQDGWSGTVISAYYPLQDEPLIGWALSIKQVVKVGSDYYPLLIYKI